MDALPSGLSESEQLPAPRVIYRFTRRSVSSGQIVVEDWMPPMSRARSAAAPVPVPPTQTGRNALSESTATSANGLASSPMSTPPTNPTNLPSLSGSQPIPQIPASPLKKKKSSIFSFFKTKEPSSQAWLDYQESIRKQQHGQQGRVSAVGMPMVSSAKLPSNVPKVNSRWDGVPDAVVQQQKDRKASNRTSAAIGAGSNLRDHSRSSSRSGRLTRHLHSTKTSISSVERPPTACSSSESSVADSAWTPSSVEPREFSGAFGNTIKAGPQTPLSDVSSFTTSLPEGPKGQVDCNGFAAEEIPEVPPIPTNINVPRTSTEEWLHARSQPTTPPRNSLHLTPGSGSSTITSDIRSTVLTAPSSRQMAVRSNGPGILAPPINALRKPKPQSLMPGQSSRTTASNSPSSIFKNITPRRKQGSIRSSRSAHSSTGQASESDRHSSRNRAIAPWDSPVSTTFRGRVEQGRSDTPTPMSGRKMLRKSRLNLFKS